MKPAILTIPALLLLAATTFADGFHSPLLRNKDPKRWGETTRQNLGLDKSDTAEEEDGAGDGFRRRAAAGQLVDVLKYLDRKNVLLREFPDFNYDKIPEFKSETEAILIAIGKDAVPLLVDTIIADMRGTVANQGGLTRVDDLRDRVVRILIAIGEDSLEKVMQHLTDTNAKVRAVMLKIVRAIVTDPDFGTSVPLWQRWHKIYLAGAKRDVKAVPEVIAALSDADRRICRAAAKALGEIRSRQAVPKLMELLDKNRDPATVTAVCRALAKIGDRRATPRLIDLLEHEKIAVRTEAATALRFLTRAMHGYEPNASLEKRTAAVLKWRQWWEREMLKSAGK
jgi:hypothetical protein